MARQIVWAYAAEEDLDAAAAYIHRDSPAYAASFVNRALQAGRFLSELAERGRMVPEFMDEKIREIFVYGYRLIYRIESDRISILGLIHGRRDFQTAWTEMDRE
ncbi:MAG: type II toxin-antitoxin system mRNA interferase toxin, RelE/StbE family [Methanomicrobiales archaeon HGW-Methanomicrobiales-5]|nr:MAG: type II toxin-antitoxin system mRNA interferase toxin, RelE/StbE family [Methanomicrobiales archaeon HGW-Methanomicrobiales-5]